MNDEIYRVPHQCSGSEPSISLINDSSAKRQYAAVSPLGWVAWNIPAMTLAYFANTSFPEHTRQNDKPIRPRNLLTLNWRHAQSQQSAQAPNKARPRAGPSPSAHSPHHTTPSPRGPSTSCKLSPSRSFLTSWCQNKLVCAWSMKVENAVSADRVRTR